VASVGDYDGDLWLDLLLRSSNGNLRVVYLRRAVAVSVVALPAATDDVNRRVIGSADLDTVPGDEIALRRLGSGEISIVQPRITQSAARTVVLTPGSSWRPLAIVGS
jgi:hypothetical protein